MMSGKIFVYNNKSISQLSFTDSMTFFRDVTKELKDKYSISMDVASFDFEQNFSGLNPEECTFVFPGSSERLLDELAVHNATIEDKWKQGANIVGICGGGYHFVNKQVFNVNLFVRQLKYIYAPQTTEHMNRGGVNLCPDYDAIVFNLLPPKFSSVEQFSELKENNKEFKFFKKEGEENVFLNQPVVVESKFGSSSTWPQLFVNGYEFKANSSMFEEVTIDSKTYDFLYFQDSSTSFSKKYNLFSGLPENYDRNKPIEERLPIQEYKFVPPVGECFTIFRNGKHVAPVRRQYSSESPYSKAEFSGKSLPTIIQTRTAFPIVQPKTELAPTTPQDKKPGKVLLSGVHFEECVEDSELRKYFSPSSSFSKFKLFEQDYKKLVNTQPERKKFYVDLLSDFVKPKNFG